MRDLFPFDHPDREEIPVLVTTSRRAFGALIDLRNIDRVPGRVWYLRSATNARRWGTGDGVASLAVHGPTSKTKLDTPCDMLMLDDVQVIRAMSDKAREAWGI